MKFEVQEEGTAFLLKIAGGEYRRRGNERQSDFVVQDALNETKSGAVLF